MGVVRRVVNNVNTVVLHGNDYVEVHERFRILYELKKDFEMIESGPLTIGERLLWRVVAKIDGKQYIAHAEIKLGAPKGTPDGTNPFECGETSAWGRLLGMAGLGTVASIASYDEIARSQPFTQVIEQPTNRIVEGNVRQITQPQEPAPALSEIKERSERLYPGRWEAVKQNVFKAPTEDENITPEKALKLHKQLLHQENVRAQKEQEAQPA